MRDPLAALDHLLLNLSCSKSHILAWPPKNESGAVFLSDFS